MKEVLMNYKKFKKSSLIEIMIWLMLIKIIM